VFPVELPQTGEAPVIVHVGSGVTMTGSSQVLVHPLAVTVTVSVNAPLGPAVTVTVGPVVALVIVPSPVIAHANVAPGVGLVTE